MLLLLLNNYLFADLVGVETIENTPIVQDQVIIRWTPDITQEIKNQIVSENSLSFIKAFTVVDGLELYSVDNEAKIITVINSVETSEYAEYVEPVYLVDTNNMIPDDPQFSSLWALDNTGQSSGTVDADINAPQAWDTITGQENIVLGVIDTGIDYNHPDLSTNMWSNPGEIPNNGIDDDSNGYIDDVHGVNTITGTGNPMDDNGHGTHVAGTMAAQGNNDIGVTGIMQNASLIGCKFLSANGSGTLADALECIQYFYDLSTRANNPVQVLLTNNSWGGGGYSRSLRDAIKAHKRQGILFIAAAGNAQNDNDASPSYPATYDLANIISVAASDRNDNLAGFSNYGSKTVHVTAPGVSILSTSPQNNYRTLSGTSMAAPHVSGLLGLVKAAKPNLSWQELRKLIISSGTKNSHFQSTISSRRIRASGSGGRGAMTCSEQKVQKKTEANF